MAPEHFKHTSLYFVVLFAAWFLASVCLGVCWISARTNCSEWCFLGSIVPTLGAPFFKQLHVPKEKLMADLCQFAGQSHQIALLEAQFLSETNQHISQGMSIQIECWSTTDYNILWIVSMYETLSEWRQKWRKQLNYLPPLHNQPLKRRIHDPSYFNVWPFLTHDPPSSHMHGHG